MNGVRTFVPLTDTRDTCPSSAYAACFAGVCSVFQNAITFVFRSLQVCVQSPASAVKVTLPAFAAERRRLLHGACSAPAAIDRYLLPAGRSAANSPAAMVAVDRWDRRTDGRTDARSLHEPYSTYYAGSVNKCYYREITN